MGSTRKLLAMLAFVLGVATVPHRVCERDAAAWLDADPAKVDALAAQVAAWTAQDLAPSSFATGSTKFDGEWQFGTYVMAAMGFGQIAGASPARREESLARMERCLDAMTSPAVLAFDTAAWGEDALSSKRGHVAALGYAGLAFALHRTLRPDAGPPAAVLDDRIARALEERLDATPAGLAETYPGEVYPVDNAAALAALALHARATGRPAPPAVARGLAAIRRAIDPASGLLYQAVSEQELAPRDAARASGTALAAYFLAYADLGTSAVLERALVREQHRTVLGFGVMLEYAQGTTRGAGDIDSGPIAFGASVSATGFALGASRVHADRDVFRSLYATTHLFGVPFDDGGARTYATGGPLGDAILFAMLTAPAQGRLS